LTWRRIDEALRRGSRGLRPGGSVVRLLHQRLGVPLRRQIGEPLTQKTIVNWAKTYHARTGTWPSVSTKERIHETGERWGTIDQALKMGHRGLPGGSSLARLLGKEKGSIRSLKRPQLHIHEVLQWADAFRERTSRWPRQASGQIPEAPGLTWMNVNHALFYGNRGFRGGSSLARLLTRYRGAMPVKRKSEGRTLSIEQIKSWILTHHASTGKWPGQKSGSVIGGPDITWSALYRALNEGRYGLPKGIRMASLRPVIEIERAGLRLSVRQIVLWARAHHRRHGFWPTPFDGRIPDAPGETWLKVEDALRRGTRGLPGGSSLAKLLKGRAKPRPMSAGNGGSRRRSATAHE
jgi:hypothetical protein